MSELGVLRQMKALLGIAAASLMFAMPAAAQSAGEAQAAPALTANCADFPAAPTLPDGASANRADMMHGTEAYGAWQTSTVAKKAACRADITALQAQLAALVEAWNQADRRLVDTNTAWVAEVAEFNGRRGGNTLRSSN